MNRRRLSHATPLLATALLLLLDTAAVGQPRREPRALVAAEAYPAAARSAEAVVVVEYVLEKEGRGFGAVGQRAEMGCLGTIVRADGLVAISNNVFPDDEDESRAPARPHGFEARLFDGTRVKAVLLGRDKETGLAFLELKPESPRAFPFVELGGDGDLVPGDEVLLTSLLPEKYDHQPSFSKAAVAGVIRAPHLRYDLDAFVQDGMICTPVVDGHGRAIGVLTTDPLGETTGRALTSPLKLMGSVTRNKVPGYPVLVPATDVLPLVKAPPRTDVLQPRERAWLGVTLQSVPRNLADYLRIKGPTGIMVTSVWSGSPAETAGLAPEDVIVEFGGKPVVVEDDAAIGKFIDGVRETPVGTEVKVKFVRRREARTVMLTLGAAPTTAVRADEYRNETFGLQAQDLTRDIIMSRGWPEDTAGAIVSEVETAGWAQVSGIQEGDLLLAVNSMRVTGVEDLKNRLEALEKDRPAEVVFFVLRDPDTLFVPVKTQW